VRTRGHLAALVTAEVKDVSYIAARNHIDGRLGDTMAFPPKPTALQN